MNKRLLLTIGDERTAWFGLRFVHSFFEHRDSLELVLFYVAPRLKEWHERGAELSPDREILGRIEEIKNTHGHASLVQAKEWLHVHGFRDDSIKTKIVFSRLGTIKDIIHEAGRGDYDSVVFGRRGLSWFEEVFEDSISHQVLWHEIDFPIWVCRQPEPGRKNVLLCADGSQPSLRAADHAAYMIAEEPRHCLTILHVRDVPGRSSSEVDDVLAKTLQAVVDGGVDQERIRTMVIDRAGVAEAALTLLNKEGYAAVAIGRTGEARGRLSRIVLGSTSQAILRQSEHCTVWICK